MEKIWIAAFIALLLWAVLKALFWKIYFQAVLLYLAECGNPIPDKYLIEKYAEKVVLKSLHIKER